MYCPVLGHSSHQLASLGWRCTRCGKYQTSQRVLYPMKSISHALKSKNSWRRRNRPFTRHIESSCVTFTYVSTSILAMGPWNGLKTWVDYLFPSVKVSGNGDIVFEEEDSEHEKGDTFLSFHRQAGRPLSRRALLAGYVSA